MSFDIKHSNLDPASTEANRRSNLERARSQYVPIHDLDGMNFNINANLWRDVLLGEPMPRLPSIPIGVLDHFAHHKLGRTLQHPNDYWSACRLFFLRVLRDPDFVFQNSKTCVDLKCFLGLPPIKSWAYAGVERAIDNMAFGATVVEGCKVETDLFDLTCSSLRKDEKDMPEAIWNFRMTYRGELFARVGLNLHREDEHLVASITNIQGVLGDVVAKVRTVDPKWPVTALVWLAHGLPKEITILRGISARYHPSRNRPGFDSNRAFSRYNRTFHSAGFSKVENEQGRTQYYEVVR